MEKNYIGYYPIKENEIKELVNLIKLYTKRDYTNVKKILKKFNCTIQQQENIKEILTNCILGTDEEFFDTQYGICIAQLQKLYRKHFVIENLSLTQLFKRMNNSNKYTKKWNEIFSASDNNFKFINYLKYPNSSGVFIPNENIIKLYKDYYTNPKIKSIIDNYYGSNTNIFIKLLEYCISENCGILEAFDISTSNPSSFTTQKSKNSPKTDIKPNKTSQHNSSKISNSIYNTTIPFSSELENNKYMKNNKSSNLIYDISEYDNIDVSSKNTYKESASNYLRNNYFKQNQYTPEPKQDYYNSNFNLQNNNYPNSIYNIDNAEIPYIPEFENDYSMPKLSNNASNLIYDVDIPELDEDLHTTHYEQQPNRKKSSNLIYDTDIPELDEDLHTAHYKQQQSRKKSSNLIYDTDIPELDEDLHTTHYEQQPNRKKSSNLIYDTDIPELDEDLHTTHYKQQQNRKKSSNLIYDTDIPDLDEDLHTTHYEQQQNRKKSSNLINNTQNTRMKNTSYKPNSINTTVSQINKINNEYHTNTTTPKEETISKKQYDNTINTYNEAKIKSNSVNQNFSTTNNIEHTKNTQKKHTKSFSKSKAKWLPLTLIIIGLYSIFNIGVECFFEFIEPYLFNSLTDITKITYVSVGIHLVLNAFIWILITKLSLKNKTIHAKDSIKILSFVLIFMILQVSTTIYLKNSSIQNDIKNKINDITNFNTEYEISKLNQEISELQSSKYSNNNLTRAKIKDLENELADYNYYLENKKIQSDKITNDYNNYFKYYSYYIPIINAIMLFILLVILKKHSEKADFIQ